MYDKQQEQIAGTMMTLETQMLSLESLQINKEALDANRLAASTMQKQIQAAGGIDKVEETMDAVEDGLADVVELQEALSRQVNPYNEDEDDLAAELEALVDEGEDQDIIDALGEVNLDAGNKSAAYPSAPVSYPAAPTAKPKMTDEERELEELERSMAM